MHERDRRVPRAGSRLFVDEAGARASHVLERGRDVVHAIGDVVHAGSAPFEMAPDGGVRAEGAEQLHVGVTDVEQDLLDALIGDDLAVDGLQAEGDAVALDGGVQVGDRDPDVIDLGEREARRHHASLRRRRGPACGCMRAISSLASETWYAGSESARTTAATPWARRSPSGLAPLPETGASST